MTTMIRTLAREELPGAFRFAERAFGMPFYDDDDAVAAYFDACEPDRCFAAFDDAAPGDIIGTASGFSRLMGVPGGLAEVTAVTDVAVAKTHRRRGVLTRLMAAQLDQAADRSAIAILFASEATIYERFGYAPCAPRVELSIDLARAEFGPRGRAALAAFDGTLTDHVAHEVIGEMASVVDATATVRPGVMTRPEVHGRRMVTDPPGRREGATELRVVLARGADGSVRGFARYAVTPGWTGHVPNGSVAIRELMALELPAEAALWRFLLDTDLSVTAHARTRPLPDPLALLLADQRRMAPTLGEGLWLRLLDIPAALAARRFSAPVDLVLEVTDAFRPQASRRWRVVATTDGFGAVTPSTAAADLTVPVTALAAAHLGSARLTDLAAGGEITEHTPGALVAATRAWSWHVPAWAPEPF